MRFYPQTLRQIINYCQLGYPYEVCGVLLGKIADPLTVSHAVPIDNCEIENPTRRYHIDPRDLVLTQRLATILDLRILGYFHSHPNGVAAPSEEDRAVAAAGESDGVYHFIVGVKPLSRVVAGPDFDTSGILWVFHRETGQFEMPGVELISADRA